MTDRGAIESIAEALDYALFYEHDLPMLGLDGPQVKAIANDLAQRILDRLAADGWTVVKTKPAETLYKELLISAGIDRAFLNGYRRCLMGFIPSYRPGVVADGEATS